jgi:hypothetical protein
VLVKNSNFSCNKSYSVVTPPQAIVEVEDFMKAQNYISSESWWRKLLLKLQVRIDQLKAESIYPHSFSS